MNEQKQKLLIEYMLSSADVFAICVPILKTKYFTPELRNAVDFILTYYESYQSLPSIAQIAAESSVIFQQQEITKDKIDYCTTEIEAFCRRKAIEEAISTSAEIVINNGDFAKVEQVIKDAVSISLNRNMGLDYFSDPETRLRSMLVSEELIPTGYTDFDKVLFGGIGRKETIIFTGSSGGGKTLSMVNFALNMVSPRKKNLNILYISLEMAETRLSQRLDSMISSISSAVWQQHISDISEKVLELGKHSGRLTVVQMLAGTPAHKMKAYLKEYFLLYGYYPDIFVVDYLDLMGTNMHVPPSDISYKDKIATEELRNLGVEFNMAVITASQLNRAGIAAATPDQTHMAGGLTKAYTTDVWASVIFTDAMRAQGEIGYKFLKTRNSDGLGKTVMLSYNNISMRITNPTELQLKKRPTLSTPTDIVEPTENNDILTLFNIT